MSTTQERKDFENWFHAYGWKLLPNKEDTPPRIYKAAIATALAAWQECSCRKRTEIHQLKLQDHKIALFVNQLTATAVEYKDCQCLRELICGIVKKYLPQNK